MGPYMEVKGYRHEVNSEQLIQIVHSVLCKRLLILASGAYYHTLS